MKRRPYKTTPPSGTKGVYWHKATQKWEVKGIGYFTTLDAAKAALIAINEGRPVERDK